MSSVTMYYGGYSFSPVPMITIGKTYQKSNASIAVGTAFNVSLKGNLVQITGAGSINATFDKIRELRNAFNKDGKYFKIECGGNILFEGYPRIIGEINFAESPDNWVFTCPYTLSLEFDHEPVNIGIPGSGENIPGLMPPYISTYTDDWSFEFDDSTSKYSLNTTAGNDNNAVIMRASHEMNAVGKSHWKGPGLTGTLEKNAWEWAKDFINTRINLSPISAMTSGILNVATTGWNRYNHMRVQRLSESEGTFGITENFVLSNKSNGVIEDFTVEIRTSQQDPFSNVSINGNIQGLEERVYGSGAGEFNIAKTKFENATGYFETIRDNLMIYPRLQALIAAEGLNLNSQPNVRVIGKSPARGLVTYSYEYDTRPSNCITGSRTESIQISDENPSDVFARIAIMGRAQGPILQSFNTVTEFRRTVNFDVSMQPPTGCSISTLISGNNPNSQVTTILCSFENDLRARYSRVLKERDSTFWEPKFGRYNRTVTWSAINCDTAPAISLCSGA